MRKCCEKCGYELFPSDEKCDKCGWAVSKSYDGEKKSIFVNNSIDDTNNSNMDNNNSSRCLKCGNVINNNYKNCPHCGSIVVRVVNSNIINSEKNNDPINIGVILLSIIIPIIGIVYGIYNYHGNKKESGMAYIITGMIATIIAALLLGSI